MLCGIALDQIMNRQILILRLLDIIGSLSKGLGNDRVQNRVRAGNGIIGTNHTELELVAR